MPKGYCETTDVKHALQEADAAFGQGALQTDMVEDAIHGVTEWFNRQTNGHWYDSNGASSDLIDTAVATATNVRLDVPSSPHPQDRQIFRHESGVRYPVTRNGPYARMRLPHPYVQTLTALRVRDTAGGTTDWVASSDFVEGRGEDYYVGRRGQQSYGATFLYVHAGSIGPRTDYGGLLTADYDHGVDYQSNPWDDVKRGVAQLAAAELVSDDDVLTAIPNDGQLIGVDTQVQQLAKRGHEKLEPYIGVAVA